MANHFNDIADEMVRILTENGYIQEEDSVYIKTKTVQGPARVISINGKVMQQPGQQKTVHAVCDLCGEGAFDDVKFELVRFELYQDGQITDEYCDSFYKDDIERFKTIAQKICE